jgi:hypothetical protein
LSRERGAQIDTQPPETSVQSLDAYESGAAVDISFADHKDEIPDA